MSACECVCSQSCAMLVMEGDQHYLTSDAGAHDDLHVLIYLKWFNLMFTCICLLLNNVICGS